MKVTNKAFAIAFGVHLDQLIKSKGLTPQDVAANANIEFKQVYRVINAENSATLSVISAIARGLGVHPKELFDFDYENE
nr:helix-turn-helix transcriptional regulator [uncultured Dyadobacter sp.]